MVTNLLGTVLTSSSPSSLELTFDLLIALISTGTLWKVFRVFSDWLQKRQSKKAFEDAVEVVETLHRLQSKLGAQRVLILKTENGGGIPHPGKPLYTSVQYEFVKDGYESIKEDFQRRLLDSNYVEMIGQLLNKQVLILDPVELPDNSMLWKVYKKFDIIRADVAKIAITKHGLFYLSCTWGEDEIIPDEVDIAYELGFAQNKLREILGR